MTNMFVRNVNEEIFEEFKSLIKQKYDGRVKSVFSLEIEKAIENHNETLRKEIKIIAREKVISENKSKREI